MSSTHLASALVARFEHLRMTDVEAVGGKNASLGEMISQLSQSGVRVPGGFATTAHAFRQFLAEGGLAKRIGERLARLDTDDVRALAEAGAEIRGWIGQQPFPPALEAAIRSEYERLAADSPGATFAVRSSATAEDLPDASFAGQQETFLNVFGIDQVLAKMREVFASLYNDRAISYRVHKGYAHGDVALSAGVQRMVRSDVGAAGVMFTIDTESGFTDVVFITSSYGLGETVVQGAVNPDEFYVHKPALQRGKLAIIRRNLGSKLIRMGFASAEEQREHGKLVTTQDTATEQRNRYSLSDADVTELARYALVIEKHYGRAMDIEWGKDGVDGKLYILQARPETVKSQAEGKVEQRFTLKGTGTVLATGRAIGQKIGTGPVRLVDSVADMERVQAGDVLVTDMTDPNWEPVMKRAAAIVTNRGGRTCHAAIIARELGIPAVVGCGDATETLKEGALVTVACSEGDTGYVYDGLLETEVTDVQRGRAAVLAGEDDDEHRQSAARVRLRADAEFRRRPGAARVHHQQQHRRASEGDPRLSEHRRRPEEGGRERGPRPCLAARLLRRQAGRGHRHDRRRVLAEAGDRAPLRLQEQRVPQAHRRLALRARGREPDARLSRRVALRQRGVRRGLRDGMRGAGPRPPRHGPGQRRGDGAVRAHPRPGRAGGRHARRAGPEAGLGRRQRRPQGDHDVRGAEQRHPRRAVPRALRRHVDRLERPDPAHPRPRPRLGPRAPGQATSTSATRRSRR